MYIWYVHHVNVEVQWGPLYSDPVGPHGSWLDLWHLCDRCRDIFYYIIPYNISVGAVLILKKLWI